VDRYRYPQQDNDLREGDDLHLQNDTSFGKLVAIDRGGRTIDVKKRGAQAAAHPSALFAHTHVPTEVLASAIERIGADVIQCGMLGGTRYRVGRELLMAREPRLRAGAFEQSPMEEAVAFAMRVGPELKDTVLAIQGPPGTGKTFTGAQMICELVSKGFNVGVTAVSHKVIRNLLDAVLEAAREMKVSVSCVQKVKEKAGNPTPGIEEVTDNADVLAALDDGSAQVGAGTAWLWSRGEYAGALDVLFVDEAGQASLANVLAMAQAAKSVVLLGDPQQLEQPQRGTHPEDVDASALEHILAGGKTIPEGRGIFLDKTWRLPPAICAFTSELFYEGRLESRPEQEQQKLSGAPPFEGAGLWFVPVEHDGNPRAALKCVRGGGSAVLGSTSLLPMMIARRRVCGTP
jgi:uncharacterized protein